MDELRHKLTILDPDDPEKHYDLTWVPGARNRAREAFDQRRHDGWFAYTLDRHGKHARLISNFDPDAETTILDQKLHIPTR
jgi:hypothetical protein